MKTVRRVVFLALACAALIAAAPEAQAQYGIECWQCDPWGSCSQSCWYCSVPHPDGYCNQWDVVQTTCGDATGACMQDNCTPNWQQTGYEAVGTYGESGNWFNCYWWGDCECEHHTVYKVTETDQNQCNLSSYYHTRQYCDDVTDGWKWSNTGMPNCCDGNPSHFSCNHWHSCF
jgi:hypothetical protein